MQEYNTKYGIKVSVVIDRDSENDIATVRVIAPLYLNKEWKMNHCYKSSHFTDFQIMKDSDFIRIMTKAFSD